MAIAVRCPNPKCGKTLSVAPELAGKTVKCAACGQVVQVPVPAMPAGADAATAPVGREPRAAQPPLVARAGERMPSPGEATAVPPRQAAAIESGVKPPHSKDPLIGAKIAHYRIQALLGEGGMGKVYKAHNTSLDKTCAIKILPQEFAKQDQTYIDRFVREARSAAKVEHTNVLPVQFVGKVAEYYFIEMQYVDGGTLGGLLKQRGKLGVKEAARIIRDVAAGLQAAHAKGIIHRDIKPTNVMLTREGHVYVMDFGLAKAAEARTALTQQGYILGTPLYMSPEQAAAQAVDHRGDIYSLGVMFYQLITGSPPYIADSPLVILNLHQTAPIPDISLVAPEVPQHIAEMIRKMMAKNPADRYQSCAEIAAELNAFLTVGGPAVVVSEEALKDAPDHRKSVLKQAKRGAKPRLAPEPAASAAPKKRSALPIALVLVLLLVLGFYFVRTRFTAESQRTQRTGTAETTKPALSKAEGTQSTPSTETAQGSVAQSSLGGSASGGPPAAVPSEQTTKSPWDDVYVTQAATGEKIPHPLSRRTYRQVLADGTTVDVPEGMVYVPAGEFTMGEKESEHRVYLDAYFIGKYEVTNAEWKVFCDFTEFTPLPQYWKDGKIPEGKENHPVVYVSWDDVQKYCEWVSAQTGRKVSLPTEAQWEKAAGWDPTKNQHNEFPWGDDFEPDRANHCWQLGCRCNGHLEIHQPWWDEWSKSDEGKKITAAGGNTTPVGSFPKGKCFYGCYDMVGNAQEWCQDWFTANYYKLEDATKNPEGPTEEQAEECDFSGKKMKARLMRGGCWNGWSAYCSTVYRNHQLSAYLSCAIGFRVVVRPTR